MRVKSPEEEAAPKSPEPEGSRPPTAGREDLMSRTHASQFSSGAISPDGMEEIVDENEAIYERAIIVIPYKSPEMIK